MCWGGSARGTVGRYPIGMLLLVVFIFFEIFVGSRLNIFSFYWRMDESVVGLYFLSFKGMAFRLFSGLFRVIIPFILYFCKNGLSYSPLCKVVWHFWLTMDDSHSFPFVLSFPVGLRSFLIGCSFIFSVDAPRQHKDCIFIRRLPLYRMMRGNLLCRCFCLFVFLFYISPFLKEILYYWVFGHFHISETLLIWISFCLLSKGFWHMRFSFGSEPSFALGCRLLCFYSSWINRWVLNEKIWLLFEYTGETKLSFR